MDGVFCPQITVGPPLVRALPDRFVKDVHLMVDEPLEQGRTPMLRRAPDRDLPRRVDAPPAPRAAESRGHGRRPWCGAQSRDAGLHRRATARRARAPPVLAVNPGWGGQHFCPRPNAASPKHAVRRGREIVVAVDGGITKGNVEHVASLGVDLIVTGSAIYDGVAPAETPASCSKRSGEGTPELRSPGPRSRKS